MCVPLVGWREGGEEEGESVAFQCKQRFCKLVLGRRQHVRCDVLCCVGTCSIGTREVKRLWEAKQFQLYCSPI